MIRNKRGKIEQQQAPVYQYIVLRTKYVVCSMEFHNRNDRVLVNRLHVGVEFQPQQNHL